MWIAPGEVAARRAAHAEKLFGELGRAGVRYALLDRTEEVVSTGQLAEVLECLVHPEDRVDFAACTRRAGLGTHRIVDGGLSVHHDGAEPTLIVTARSELFYGCRERCIETGAQEDLVLERAKIVDGVSRPAASDELVHVVLTCLLDREAFTVRDRARLAALIRALMSEPVAAGHAAERVGAELAPALPWAVLQSLVLHERWQVLLDHAPPLRRQLVLAAPVGTAVRWLASYWNRLLGSHGETIDRYREDSDDDEELGARADEDPVLVEVDGVEGRGETGGPEQMSKRQIRGSGLLLAGRGLSTGLKFLAELLIIRYLATEAYGSWTYALAAVAFLRVIATLGLNRAVVRFLPVHLERGERGEFFGVIAFVLGCLLLSTGVTVAAFYAFPDVVARLAGAAPDQPLDVLFIIILLVPIDALDDFLTGILAAFADARTLFIRRYLLSPGLRIAVALTLVFFAADVRLLAYGYLIAGVVGLVYFAWIVYQGIRARGLLERSVLSEVRLPARRVLSYTFPVMVADGCQILLMTIGPLMLGYFSGMSAVAMFRVVIPLVTLIQLVRQTFVVLFEPAASRLDARGHKEGLETFYWRAALWVAVLTFPAFAVSFALAEPMTVLLFGERYRAAGPILSFLALGAFVESLVGFNASTLRMVGRLRWLNAVSVLTALVSVVLHVALIRAWGAFGAGIATGLSWAVYALMAQVALWKAAGVTPFDTRYTVPYLTMLGCTIWLAGLRIAFPDAVVLLAGSVIASVVVVLMSARRRLSITETFPELARFRIVRWGLQ
jgi:O-antigen/teichoic acid export membrane protein